MTFTPNFRPDPKPEPREKRKRIPLKRVPINKTRTARQWLEKCADDLFSVLIRRRNANEWGMVHCFTCENYQAWKNMDCGHFASRSHHSTRWHENNCQAQCKTCNGEMAGNLNVFAKNLDGKYGVGTADELGALSRLIQPWSNDQLRELIESLKLKIKQLPK
jgi:hypothetical protein